MYLEISNPMDYHVALYIRLSKEDETEGPSQSVTNQKSLLNEFVQQHRLSVYDTYVDDGWSGTSFDRPDFQRMIEDIEAKKVNMVITKDLSRLGRDYIMTGHYMERYFPEKRVRYISLLDGIDTGVESTANDITPFRAIMNDMYAKDISKKVRTALTAKKQAGRFIGSSAPFGYRRENGVLIPVKEQAEVVKTIFKLFLKENNLSAVARELNRMDVATPSMVKGGKKNLWSDVMVHRILENPTYAGHLTQNKTRRINYKVKKREKLPENLWICVKNTHEPIVPEKEFETVKNKLTKRGETGIIK